ncbi:MAG: hypothetical protein WDN01_06160 [Rhizomicrobium sp.]
MRYLIDAVAAVLFVVSTGLLFSEAVRARRVLFILVGVVTLASSYVIAKDVLDATVGHRMHHRRATVAASTAAPAPDTALNDFSATDALLEQIYGLTESALNRIVRAGTKQSTASVSSDTVVDVIVGLSLAALGVLSQLFSSLYRRLFGAEA